MCLGCSKESSHEKKKNRALPAFINWGTECPETFQNIGNAIGKLFDERWIRRKDYPTACRRPISAGANRIPKNLEKERVGSSVKKVLYDAVLLSIYYTSVRGSKKFGKTKSAYTTLRRLARSSVLFLLYSLP